MKEQIEKMPERYPENGTFELTVRCNLHCKMCMFRHDDSENGEIRRKELSAAQWIDLARQAAEMGTVGLLITGGEPMLRPDFAEIYEEIYRQGFLIQLYTNATLVTPAIMELLKRCPPHKIGITIYGASAETYGRVCGDADAFQRMIQGVHALLTLPSVVDFRTTIIQDNYADVGAMEELICREFEREDKLTQTRMVMKAVRGGCAKVENCRLSPEENVRLVYRRSIEAVRKIIGEGFDEKYIRLKRINRENEECRNLSEGRYTIFGCSGGMSSYTVTWDGKLQACQVLGAYAVDAVGQSLAQAWEKFLYEVNLPVLDERCQNCEITDLCQCCPASRYAETGSAGGYPEYACRDAYRVSMLMDAYRFS